MWLVLRPFLCGVLHEPYPLVSLCCCEHELVTCRGIYWFSTLRRPDALRLRASALGKNPTQS